MSEPEVEVLHEWDADMSGQRFRVVRSRKSVVTKELAIPGGGGRWVSLGEEDDAYEIARLAATVKVLREERELAREALALCRADIKHRPKLSAHVDALIDRLASPSVPAVSAEEEGTSEQV